tara:strand:+ start:643 stop:996 length:354 start_codon:yes stop_codon:yes gene_type:complete
LRPPQNGLDAKASRHNPNVNVRRCVARKRRAEARCRAIDNQRRREEEKYQGIFGQVPDPADEAVTTNHPSPASNNVPTVIAPPAAEPANVPEEIVEESKTDPGAIREELKRRQETSE